ncbi:MAG: hypothetical protein AB1791_01255 [Chloroflexota bacterium]
MVEPDPTRYVRAFATDLAWVQQECGLVFDPLPTPLRDLAHRYLERLSPDKAQVEWCLPLWLGQAFGVETAVARTMALTNVLGMLYIRMQNDGMDGDVSPAEAAYLLTLSPLLYTRCVSHFTTLFPAASPFWGYLEAYLNEWAAAVAWERERHWLKLEPYTEAEVRWLTAGKGAPEKIGCAGLALLAGRDWAIPHLATVMDLRSTIAQLFDDFCDWREDWQRGRYNVFLTMVLTDGQRHQLSSPTISDLLEAIYHSKRVVELFDRADHYAALARQAAVHLECEPLLMLCDKAVSVGRLYRQMVLDGREQMLLQRFSRLADNGWAGLADQRR